MYGLSLPGARLGEEVAQRARRLFGTGHLAAYGLMFRHAFTFQKNVLAWNSRVKHAAGILIGGHIKGTLSVGGVRDFVLGVHVRHMMKKDEGNEDTRGELECVKEMLSKHVPKYDEYQARVARPRKDKEGKEVAQEPLRCVVILASDRQPTLDRLRRDIEWLGCR